MDVVVVEGVVFGCVVGDVTAVAAVVAATSVVLGGIRGPTLKSDITQPR